MHKEIRFSYSDFVTAAIKKLTEENPEIEGMTIAFIKYSNYEPAGIYLDHYYEEPDEVSFTDAKKRRDK